MTNRLIALAPQNRHPAPTAAHNIIIIDDNLHDLKAVETMVQASRVPLCQTTSFTCIDDAIESGTLPDADLILLDDRLAGGTTAEYSLQALRKADINCPAIVMSAIVRNKRDRAVIRHGAVQFTSKEELTPTAMQRLLAYGLTARGLWSLDGT